MGGLADRWIGDRREMSNYIKLILMPNNSTRKIIDVYWIWMFYFFKKKILKTKIKFLQ